MIIRKQFSVEMGHIVRNCSSARCAHSQHGHSAIIEVLLEGSKLDNAGMLYDFGLMKGTIKQFIDMFDHCYVFWDKDDPEFIEYIKKYNERWISLPFNPTAEMLSLMFMNAINWILTGTIKNNGETSDLRCTGVIYHETATGYAQCSLADNNNMWCPENIHAMKFSPAIVKEQFAAGSELRMIFVGLRNVTNPEPFKQVNANPTGIGENAMQTKLDLN
jgi:6-pyruvoyltetrahydropterin/6-carboxytetrahydropterin synthase